MRAVGNDCDAHMDVERLLRRSAIGVRNAALVIWGMPVAYMGAILLMLISDLSVNVITTFSLLLVTGIIVDDAIAVGIFIIS